MALILLFRRWSFVGREKAGSAGSGFFSAGDLFRTVMTGVNRRDQRRQSTADCLPSFGKWQLVTVCCSPSPSGLFSRDVKPHLRVARTGRPASRRRRLTRDKCFWRRARSGAVRARTQDPQKRFTSRGHTQLVPPDELREAVQQRRLAVREAGLLQDVERSGDGRRGSDAEPARACRRLIIGIADQKRPGA